MAEEFLKDKGEEFALQIWKDRNVKGGERKPGGKPGRHYSRTVVPLASTAGAIQLSYGHITCLI